MAGSGYLNLIIGRHATYEDGDILSACNRLTIRRMAGWRVCGERNSDRQFSGLNRDGFLPSTHLLRDWHEAVCECRFERLNRIQAKLIRLSDLREIVVTTGELYTNFRGQTGRQMHVEQFCRRQIATFKKTNAQGKALFSDDGDDNKISLYYGRTDSSHANMDTVWTAIMNKTGRLEADETTYRKEPPFGGHKRGRVVVRVDDFSDRERGD